MVYGRAAETWKEYLKKGRQIYVEGRLRTREYEARNNGGKRRAPRSLPAWYNFSGRLPPMPRPPKSAAIALRRSAVVRRI